MSRFSRHQSVRLFPFVKLFFRYFFFFLVTFLSQPVVWLPTTFQTTSVIFDLGTCEYHYLFFFLPFLSQPAVIFPHCVKKDMSGAAIKQANIFRTFTIQPAVRDSKNDAREVDFRLWLFAPLLSSKVSRDLRFPLSDVNPTYWI